MRLQHVICLESQSLNLTLEKLKKKMAFEVVKNEYDENTLSALYVTCMRIMHSMLSSFSFQPKM